MMTRPMNASALLAMALTGAVPTGPHRCFYCGHACDESHARRDHVKDTFTDLGAVRCPRSEWVCAGCVLSMREKIEMPGHDKPQKARNYSWLITPCSATPYSKAQIPALRRICLEPPAPPYAIAIATSGQKHVIFKTPVCHSPHRVVVCLEGEVVDFTPDEFAERMALVTRIVANTGKPALAGEPDVSMAMRIFDACGEAGMHDFDTWKLVWSQPLSRLAVFLAPSKQEAST